MNIFKTLKRGNQREEEFFSASLAILLAEIPELTSFLIKTLLKKTDVESLEVILEDTISNGRIDIALKSPHLEVYIENKVSSGLGELQLERYYNHLQNIDNETKLILLTRDYIEDESIGKYVDKYIRWYEIYSKIENFKDSISDYVEVGKDKKIYLLKQFLQFLKDENMSIEKVSWEYSEGVKSFLNLLNMIQSELDQLKKEKAINSYGVIKIGTDYAGIYINQQDLWVGVNYPNFNELCFSIQAEFVKRYDDKFEGLKEKDGYVRYYYNFNETYFLAFPKEKQKEAIFNFIKDCINDLNKLIK